MKVLGVLGVLVVILQISGGSQGGEAPGEKRLEAPSDGQMCCYKAKECTQIAKGCASEGQDATQITLFLTSSAGAPSSCRDDTRRTRPVPTGDDGVISFKTRYTNLFLSFLNKTCEKAQSGGARKGCTISEDEVLPTVEGRGWSVELQHGANSSHVWHSLTKWCGIEGNITKAIETPKDNKLTKVHKSGDGCGTGAFANAEDGFPIQKITKEGNVTLAVPYQHVTCTRIIPEGAEPEVSNKGPTQKQCTYELKIGASVDATPISNYLCTDDGFENCTIAGRKAETRCKANGGTITITGVGLAQDGKNELNCTKTGSGGTVDKEECEINVKGLDVNNGGGNYTCPQASVNKTGKWCTTPKCNPTKGSKTGTLCTVDSSASSTRSINTSRGTGGGSAGGDAHTETGGGTGGGGIVTTTTEGKDAEEHATQTTDGGNTGKADRQGNENNGQNTNHHEHTNQEVTDNSTDPRISALQSSHAPKLKLSLLPLLAFF